MSRIKKNAVLCLRCNTEIVSEHRHDFKFCPCGNIAVDGGTDYLKRAGGEHGFEDKSVYSED